MAMAGTQDRVTEVFAPAKINLYLHVTGRRLNGYHEIDSLVCFADIGDVIRISRPKTQGFSFNIEGRFSKNLDSNLQNNLVIRAAYLLANAAGKTLDCSITLTKNLPVASGIGGGSSDAAATIFGLQKFWGLDSDAPYITPILQNLGADVPVCMACSPSIMRGIGENIFPAPAMPEIPIVLVNPLKTCPTAQVFSRFNSPFKKDISIPAKLHRHDDLISFLQKQDNDLTMPAQQIIPEISNILAALSLQNGCSLARLSGSGATCFGLFKHESDAKNAAKNIIEENPDWWVECGYINSIARY